MKYFNKTKQFLSFLLVFAMLFAISDGKLIQVQAASGSGNGDYSVRITDATNNQCKIIFQPVVSAKYVIIHYKVNNGPQLNVTMAGSGMNWEQLITGLNRGDSITYSFTYEKQGPQYDSPSATYVLGSEPDPTAVPTQTPGVSQDYSIQISDVSSSQCKIVFTPAVNSRYVIIHYTVNNGSQLNVTMTNKGSAWELSLKDLNPGARIGYFFTYEKNGAQYDTPSMTHILGASATPAPTNTPAPGVTPPPSVTPGPTPDVPTGNGAMTFQFNNRTNGKYSDSQIYWCIIGYHPDTGKLCYVDTEGNLIPATEALNTIPKNGRMCADINYTLAQKSWVSMPNIVSGRMYMSYGSPVYLTMNTDVNGNTGFAGPDLNNTSDPNQDVYFEFIEFTIKKGEYWGNTTRVDNFCFPVVTRLFGSGGYDNYPGDAPFYDKTVGDIGTRDEIFAAFAREVPAEFKSLVQSPYRIVAPCKGSFNTGEANSGYFDAYINQIWNTYSAKDLVFSCDAGTFRGRVTGNDMIFSKDNGPANIVVHKPNTQEVLEGKGVLDTGTSIEKVVEAQLCAAINRGVALSPDRWNDSSAFYKQAPANYYAKFWHDHGINGLAYGFCYDDVFSYSTLLHYTKPKALIIDLKW